MKAAACDADADRRVSVGPMPERLIARTSGPVTCVDVPAAVTFIQHIPVRMLARPAHPTETSVPRSMTPTWRYVT